MYLLHGLPADQIGRVVPTTRLVLAHRHPADRVAVARAWAHLIAEGNLVAARYRIIGFDGVVRPVYAMASTDQQSGLVPTVVTGVLQLEAPAAQQTPHPCVGTRGVSCLGPIPASVPARRQLSRPNPCVSARAASVVSALPLRQYRWLVIRPLPLCQYPRRQLSRPYPCVSTRGVDPPSQPTTFSTAWPYATW